MMHPEQSHSSPDLVAPVRAVKSAHTAGAATAKSGVHSTATGRFLYTHRDMMKNPVAFVGYQAIRNMLAAIPYGIATAAVWEGFERITRRTAAAKPGEIGYAVHSIARSPVRDIAMIAAGFTLYRGTLKLVRIMKEHLLNPDYTPEQAQQAANTASAKACDALREIAPAEINSTPYGAIALGLGRRYLDGITDYRNRAAEDKIAGTVLGKPELAQPRMLRFTREGKFAPHLTNVKEFFHKIGGKGTRVWAEAGVFTLAFLSFFELSDRLYKDVQVRRGVWNGEHSSLARVSPEKAAAVHASDVAQGKDQDTEYQAKKHAGGHTEVFGKSDPNLLRLAFTRVLPTILGIGAYTFTKRSAYLAMGHFTGKNTFWKRAFVEGAATSTFFVMTATGDAFENLWKKMTADKAPPLDAHQEEKYAQLLSRIQQKEQQSGRTA